MNGDSRELSVEDAPHEDRPREAEGPRGLGARFMTKGIRFYQRYLSPLHPPCCIYTPTCSQYAVEAIAKYGALKGGWLAIKRICRCHPFHEGGYDPVP